MNWGKSIALTLVAFALFIGSLVTVCIRQDISLVSKQYYHDELRYQQEIDLMNNTAALHIKPVIQVEGEYVEVHFEGLDGIESGTLKLTRPSDANYDATFDLSEHHGQRFELTGFPKGKYNARLNWKMNGREFLMKYQIYL